MSKKERELYDKKVYYHLSKEQLKNKAQRQKEYYKRKVEKNEN